LITRMLLPKEPEPVVEPTKRCSECLETVPADARKCRACGSQLS